MTTKREAAVMRLAKEARRLLGQPKEERWGIELANALIAYDSFDDAAAPDEAEAGREERTEAQQIADAFAYDLPQRLSGVNADNVPPSLVPTLLVAIRDDLRALAAAVKERR